MPRSNLLDFLGFFCALMVLPQMLASCVSTPQNKRESKPSNQTIFIPVKNDVQARTIYNKVSETGVANDDNQIKKSEKPHFSAINLDIGELQMLHDIMSEHGTFEVFGFHYIKSYVIPLALDKPKQIGFYLKSESNIIHGSLSPTCKKMDDFLYGITKAYIDSCNDYTRTGTNLIDSTRSEYHSIEYEHSRAQNYCGGDCLVAQPFARWEMFDNTKQCGPAIVHLFKDDEGKEYKLLSVVKTYGVAQDKEGARTFNFLKKQLPKSQKIQSEIERKCQIFLNDGA